MDYTEDDRGRVLYYMLKEHLQIPNIHTAHIITFNTISLKGAIKDIGRGLEMPLQEVEEISKAVHDVSEDENKVTVIDDEWRQKYPELFKYVDMVTGTITSIGSHPSGVLVTDKNIEEEIGTCYLKDNEYPVSCLNMKELDSLNYVKYDVLGLDNVTLINKTCELVGIPRLSANAVDIDDENVWKSIQQNTDLIFQASGNFGSKTIGKIFSESSKSKIFKEIKNFSNMDLFSFTNALLRPCGKSVYKDATEGIARMSGVEEIDEVLGSELGYPLFQETQMEFVMRFCGYSFVQADKLRKCIAKGTLVSMADGTKKKIEDVVVGDIVLSYHNGLNSKQKVLNTWNNGIQHIFKVILEDGSFIRCTSNHKILTDSGWKEQLSINVYKDKIITEKGLLRINKTVYYGREEVYDLEIEDTHNFYANGIVVHNCVAKKIGTKEQLPIIEQGFKENAQKRLNLTDEQADNIIKPFLQCILDATRYSFCRIHSYSYSYIGYMCAYLRYYYPLEYLTTCLNVWKNNKEKTVECMNYAQFRKIKILAPKFRYGRSDYSCDKESNAIYKGMQSIKYLNSDCCNYLYSLRGQKYERFVDLLYDVCNSGYVNSRQLDVLIKLNFFEEFGHEKELLRITRMFEFFKNGKAKTLSKSKVQSDGIFYMILKRNSKETEKTFTQLNTTKILSELEDLIKSWNLKKFSMREIMEYQNEFLGYIDVSTGEKMDRPKIIVLSKRLLKTKNTGKVWAITITGHSIGSGKETEYTILNKTSFKYGDFEIGDIIYIDSFSKNGDYFYINEYHKIFQ